MVATRGSRSLTRSRIEARTGAPPSCCASRSASLASRPRPSSGEIAAEASEACSAISSPDAAASSLTGAPGIGKTRLLTELATAGADDVIWLEGRCHSYGGLPGWPFVEMLSVGARDRRARDRDPAKARAGSGRSSEAKPMPCSARAWPASCDFASKRRRPRRRNRTAPCPLARTLREARPVIVAIEDTQWADAPTRRLAERVLELTDRAPLGLVLTEEPIPGPRAPRFDRRARGFGAASIGLALDPLSDAAAEPMLVVLLATSSTRRPARPHPRGGGQSALPRGACTGVPRGRARHGRSLSG